MAVSYDTTTKSARMTATRDTVADGTLEVCTAGYATVVGTIGLTGGGGSISSGVWTLAFDAASFNASNAGTLAIARIKDSGGTARITGLTVGTSAADIIVDNTNVTAGQQVNVGTVTLTHV